MYYLFVTIYVLYHFYSKAKVPAERQTFFFTATWPREVVNLAYEFLKNPVELKFGDVHNLNANKDIKQVIKFVAEGDKPTELKNILTEINPGGVPGDVPKTIIFVSRKHSCDK